MKKFAILLAILALPTTVYFILSMGNHEYKKLPIVGPRSFTEGSPDTVFHTIPPFKLVNQNGDTITEESMLGNVYVAKFFFATCPTICPKMTVNMKYIQDKFKGRKNFRLLSMTVNPAHDTVEVLKEYANKVHADEANWDFVTGKDSAIYDLAFSGYFVNAMKDTIAPGGFLHSDQLILVDKKGQVRGYFNGTEHKNVKQDLIDAIDILFKEEVVPLSGTKREKIEQRRS